MSGVLGLLLAWPRLNTGNLSPPPGRAQLTRVLEPHQRGWQASIDARSLGFGDQKATGKLLAAALGQELRPQELALLQEGPALLSRFDGDPKVSVVAQPALEPLQTQDKPFRGTPSVVFEWSKNAMNMRGNLFPTRRGGEQVYSGKLVGVLPFRGLAAHGDGVSLDTLAHLPAGVERLLAIDATMLRFLPTYRQAVETEWGRWEFRPLASLGNAIGPTLAYATWQGEPLFSFGIKDVKAVESAIDKRFPQSVVPTDTRWSFGSRIHGFDPDGPAWTLRGDNLWATKAGGTARLDSALRETVENERSLLGHPSPLIEELKRLAAQEAGWHAIVIMAEPNRPLHWGAVIRWPLPNFSSVNGFLVVWPRVAPPSNRGSRPNP